MELHRGRLIDHIQLVVADLDASRRFYEAVFKVLDIPVESNAPSHFWGDELFISTPDGPEAVGKLTDAVLASGAIDVPLVRATEVAVWLVAS